MKPIVLSRACILLLVVACGSSPSPSPSAEPTTGTERPDEAPPNEDERRWRSLVAGPASSCVIGEDRVPWCFGVIEGLLDDEDRPGPTALTQLGAVDELVLIDDGGCAITEQRLRCFHGATPLLPDDTEEDDYVPFVDIAERVSRVDMGVYYACAVATDHTASCWRTGERQGEDGEPQLGVLPVDTNVLQFVADWGIRCRLGTDRVLQCKGSPAGLPSEDRPWTTVPGIGAVAEIGLMRASVCALEQSGGVVCFGYGGVAREDVRDDATYYADEPLRFPELGASKLVTAHSHGCVLADGEVWCWGSSAEGQLGVQDDRERELVNVTQLSGATDIAVGDAHTCALVEGRLRCVGNAPR